MLTKVLRRLPTRYAQRNKKEKNISDMNESKLIYRCWAKATQKEDNSPRYSMNWAASRRAFFSIYEDKITCGNWTMPTSEIIEAVAYRTSQMFIPVTVLELRTRSGTFQFGFNPWTKPVEHLPISYRE